MSTTKSLLIGSPYFPPEGGGLEAYVASLAGALSVGHGWRVVVVTTGAHRSGVRREERDGLVVHRLAYHLRLSNTRFGLTWRRQLGRLVRDERPALINAPRFGPPRRRRRPRHPAGRHVPRRQHAQGARGR